MAAHEGIAMKNLEWCIYTYRHRRAFEYCVKKLVHDPALREEMLRRAAAHDMDKMLTYTYMDQKEAQKLHVSTCSHHLENQLPKAYEDLVEAVIDYECAPYTKPDKPINAYGLINTLKEWKALDPEYCDKLLEITETLGIAYSSSYEDDEEGKAYIASLGEVTEEMIRDEIRAYDPEFEIK